MIESPAIEVLKRELGEVLQTFANCHKVIDGYRSEGLGEEHKTYRVAQAQLKECDQAMSSIRVSIAILRMKEPA